MAKVPRPESEYFGKQDVLKKRRLIDVKREKKQKEELKKIRELHHGHCSDCGMEMHEETFKGTTIYRCDSCGGAFLSVEALQKLCGTDPKIIDSLLDLFNFK